MASEAPFAPWASWEAAIAAWEEAALKAGVVLSGVGVHIEKEFDELCRICGVDGLPAVSQFRNHILKLQQQQQHSPKRPKDLSSLGPQVLVAELLELAAPQIGTTTENPKRYRWPYDESVTTWNTEEMQTQLCEKRELIHERLKRYNENDINSDRESVVIGIRLGSGFGKTHALTEAPTWLGARGLYVTYNLEQNIVQDVDSPVKTFLVRLILVVSGCSQNNCGVFIRSNRFKPFLDLDEDVLRECFVVLAKQSFGGGEILIGVDEVMMLGEEGAKAVVSELGKLSHAYSQTEPKSKCTCMVTSLADKAFRTHSGRSVEYWIPRRPDRTTFQHFGASASTDSLELERSMALSNAVSGNHVRSIAIAFSEIKLGSEPTVNRLLSKMSGRMGNKISQEDFAAVRAYVEDCLKLRDPPAPSGGVEELVGDDGSLPPAIIAQAFTDRDGVYELGRLFNAFSLFDGGAGKHLEAIGKWYDLFRSRLELPVVPHRAIVHAPKKPPEWYRNLVFQLEIESSADLLKLRNIAVSKKMEVVRTGVQPVFGTYYHPGSANHPLLDRLLVAKHKYDGSECMIIYQDKVNNVDFASACQKLEQAAGLLYDDTEIEEVLLVVNVIGASGATLAQKKLTRPHILVRQAEVEAFYSCNFAGMVHFARERHLLSLQSGASSVPLTANCSR